VVLPVRPYEPREIGGDVPHIVAIALQPIDRQAMDLGRLVVPGELRPSSGATLVGAHELDLALEASEGLSRADIQHDGADPDALRTDIVVLLVVYGDAAGLPVNDQELFDHVRHA